MADDLEAQIGEAVMADEQHAIIFGCWWWLSFSDSGFLGAAVVEGADIGAAVKRADELGCNPGGEVLGVEIEAIENFAPELRNRLLSYDDLVAAGLEPEEAEVERG